MIENILDECLKDNCTVNISSLHQRISQIAQQTPNQIALRYQNQTLTYAELDKRSTHFAITIQRAFACHFNRITMVNSVIGLHVQRGFNLIISILAILKSGAAYVTLPTEYPKSRLDEFAGDAKLKFIITEQANQKLWLAQDKLYQILCIDILPIEKEAYLEKAELTPNSLAAVLYTSHFMGKFQKVVITHKNIFELLEAQEENFKITKDDCVLQFFNINFDASIWEWSMALLNGATLVLVDNPAEMNTRQIEQLLYTNKITIAMLPSFISTEFIQKPLFLRKLLTSGECNNGEIFNFWNEGKSLLRKQNQGKPIQDDPVTLQTIVEQIPVSIYWKNKVGKYLGCNSKTLEMLGLTSMNDLLGKSDKDLHKFKDLERLHSHDKFIVETGQHLMLEETINISDNNQIITAVNKLPLRNEKGEIVGIIGILIDITHRKKLESELSQSKKIAETYGSMIAHELRTPLMTIGMNAHGISNTLPKLFPDNENVNDNRTYVQLLKVADDIAFEVRCMDLIINMMLANVSSTNQKEIELQTCSINDCVNEALQRYPFMKRHKDTIHFLMNVDFDFLGERNLLVHVLFNLIKNALYFIDVAQKGEITIWTEITSTENFLYFKDTGTGISEKNLPFIFDQFYSRSYHGVGLGLAFCKMVMKQFGGGITCNSIEGEYTEFILSFPNRTYANSN